MALSDWEEIYRAYEPAELTAEIVLLRKNVGVFASQQTGSRSYTKDLRELRDRLQAAQRVQEGRSRGAYPAVALVDVSG